MSNAQKITTLAIVGILATISFVQNLKGGESELVTSYSAIAGVHQQSVNFGWVPQVTHTKSEPITGGTGESAERYRAAISEPGRAAKRQSLRRAYREGRNPYAGKSKTEGEVDCDCEACFCTSLVCKAGDCKKNYVLMVSAPWCGPCKDMYPILTEMRKQGYIVYFYDIEKFEDIDAKYDVESVPTFIVFDNGKEVARNVGTVDKEWFLNNLKKRDDQEVEEESDNLYDVIAQ
jgi:thioredoxin 1